MHQKMIMYVMRALMLCLLTWTSGAYQQQPFNFTDMKPTTSPGSFFIFPVTGNVYPLGYYTVAIRIVQQPNPFLLDIDTGSDLTWVTCDSAKPPPRNLYNIMVESQLVHCQDPACIALGNLRKDTHTACKAKSLGKKHPCDYTIRYADGTSSSGFLVRDTLPLQSRNGKWVNPQLVFGCGRYQQHEDKMRQRIHDGILGLGKGSSGILNQLSNMGIIENMVGYCFSGKGGGFLFFGDLPIFGIVWKQIDTSAQHYYLGSANILFGGHVTDIRGLHIVFDSGSTYTYLNSRAYEALLDLVWEMLSFSCTRNLILSSVESLLRNTERREMGLGDLNLIGDISMHDKLVIYDNKRGNVGWAEANCNVPIKVLNNTF